MYRNDLTPTAPASYDDVLANAKAQNKPGSLAGYIIRGKATNPVVADFLPILWSQGGDVFDENWNVVLDNDASKAAIAFLVNDLKGVAQTDPGSTDASDRDKIMANGQGSSRPSGRARSTQPCSTPQSRRSPARSPSSRSPRARAARALA